MLKVFALMVKGMKYGIHVLGSCSHGSNLLFLSYLRILERAEGRAKATKGVGPHMWAFRRLAFGVILGHQ